MRGFGWWGAGNRSYRRWQARAERNWLAYVALAVAPGLCGVLLAWILLPLAGRRLDTSTMITFTVAFTVVGAAIATRRWWTRRHAASANPDG